jgi:hypothetical protein
MRVVPVRTSIPDRRRLLPSPILVDLDLVKYPALVLHYSEGAAAAAAAAFFCITYRGKLLQHKLIRVQCTKKSTRVSVSPVPQYGYWI